MTLFWLLILLVIAFAKAQNRLSDDCPTDEVCVDRTNCGKKSPSLAARDQRACAPDEPTKVCCALVIITQKDLPKEKKSIISETCKARLGTNYACKY